MTVPTQPAQPTEPTRPVEPAAPTTGPAADPDTLIAGHRARIDGLDARIIELVQQRMALSAAVQAARIGAGGRRVHLTRELEILRTYGDALGRPGTSVAMSLLELCRGTA